jgi:hypothetical protein
MTISNLVVFLRMGSPLEKGESYWARLSGRYPGIKDLDRII